MEQRPEPDRQPLEPPSVSVAQAYLAESERVTRRREQRIDRRAASRLLLVEGAVFAVYLSALMFAFPPADGNIIVIITPFLIWTQLVLTLREEYGYQRRGREQRLRAVVVAILVVMVIGSLTTLYFGMDIPPMVRLAPGLVAFLLYAILAWDERRRAMPGSRRRRQRTAFDRSARLTTAGIGIGLGAIISCVASPSALVANVVNLVVMLALAGWLLSATVTGGARVATAWGVYQWSCFAAGGAVVVSLLLLGQFTGIALAAAGYAAGAAVALAFVAGAVMEPKRA